MIYGLWHGGTSYALGSIDTDLETFASIAHAVAALKSRERSNGLTSQAFAYVSREPRRDYCPCVDGSEMSLWLTDPREHADPYPDRVITFGPRGGVKVERA